MSGHGEQRVTQRDQTTRNCGRSQAIQRMIPCNDAIDSIYPGISGVQARRLNDDAVQHFPGADKSSACAIVLCELKRLFSMTCGDGRKSVGIRALPRHSVLYFPGGTRTTMHGWFDIHQSQFRPSPLCGLC